MDENDWEELELEQDEEGELGPGLAAERTTVWPWVVWVLLAVSLLLGLGYYLTREKVAPPEAVVPETAPATAELDTGGDADVLPAPEEPPIELPPLSASDAFVREMTAGLSAHPELASIFLTDDLLRRFVVAVVNVADGESPRRMLPHLRPEARFAAARRGGRLFVDPESYARYDGPAEIFASLDAEGTAKLVRILEPLTEEAFAELGLGASRSFSETLPRAIAQVLAAPAVDGPIALRAESVNYTYEDERLERLSDAQKHLLRMGPENTRRVQAKLEEIVGALGLTLPPES